MFSATVTPSCLDRRHVAASILEFYTRRHPDETTDLRVEDMFADLVLEADDRQYAVFWQRIKEDQEVIVPKLYAELSRMPPGKAAEDELDSLASRKANAAVTLLRLRIADEKVWKLLQHSEDPSVRTYIVHRLMPYGIPVAGGGGPVVGGESGSLRTAGTHPESGRVSAGITGAITAA